MGMGILFKLAMATSQNGLYTIKAPSELSVQVYTMEMK